MSSKTLAALAVILTGAACERTHPGTAGPGGACTVNADCQAGLVCLDGDCTEAVPAGADRCSPSQTRCNGGDVEVCGSDAAWSRKETCATRCAAGACVPAVCAPPETRCSSDSAKVEACAADGTTWVAIQACSAGCSAGVCATQGGPICTGGEKRCTGDVLEQCVPNGMLWAFVEYCPTGCDSATKACTPRTCMPMSTQCNASGARELCNMTGTAYEALPCPGAEVCDDGGCRGTGGTVVCAPATTRCNGNREIEICRIDGSGYDYVQSCLGACSGGACATPACTPAFTLTANPSAALPADTSSRLLVVSGVIADADGVPVPDGTLFTIAASADTGGTSGGDADPTTTGVQIASVNGRIDFWVKAGPTPAAASTATASAVAAPKCAATAAFAQVTPAAGKYFAEDFTTTTFRDAATTTADWRTEQGLADNPLATMLGQGEDGDLIVLAGTTFDPATAPNPARYDRAFADAPSARVTAFVGANAVDIDAAMPIGIGAGDEVLLVNAQGSSTQIGNVGNFEILAVESVAVSWGSSTRVTFGAPVAMSYGAPGNGDLTGQTVLLQRIPHYGNVAVAGTISSSSGVLFVKSNGNAYVTGSITEKGRGYGCDAATSNGVGLGGVATQGAGRAGAFNRNGFAAGTCGCNDCGDCSCWNAYGAGGSGGYGTAGTNPASCFACGAQAAVGANGGVYGAPQLDRLLRGGGGAGLPGCGCGGAGGGIVSIWSRALFLSGNGVITADGNDGAGNGGGAGGSVWLRAATMSLGSGKVTARGGAAAPGAGGAGRVRLDYGALTSGNSTTPAHYAAGGVDGTVQVRTVAFYSSSVISQARVVAAVEDRRGGTITYAYSADGGANWTTLPYVSGTLAPLTALSQGGADNRLRVTLASDGSNEPLSVEGVVVELAP